MTFAAALSEHPLATHATGEVVGALLEALGPEPDLAMIFVTGAHLGALDDIAATVRATLAPRCLVGVTAVSVLGAAREVEERAAVSAWAARLAPAHAVRIEATPVGDTVEFTGLPEAAARPGSTLLLLADPFSFALDPFLDGIARQLPGLQVIGGLASAAAAPGVNRLALDDRVFTDGAVGVLLGPEWPVTTVVSQGCRPVGAPFTVTAAERSMLYEIAGMPALEKLREVVAGLDPDDRALAARGLHLGRLIDEHALDPDRGDFLVRNVRGGDPGTGAIAVADDVEVGATVQFQVRDADSADEDLRHLLADVGADRPPASALVFTCNGRGVHLFGEPDHDATLVTDIVGPAVAGMFCAGELGPIGGRPFLHGFSASIALFGDRSPTTGGPAA
jgi:small ligand-binding sensory domain FIST